jgi:cytochrome bd-type quinol oxidase subunit 2
LRFCYAPYDIFETSKGNIAKKQHNTKEEFTMNNIITTLVTFANGGTTTASGNGSADFNGVVQPIVDLLNKLMNPLLLLVGAGGVLFCIMLGVKYATAEEPQEREKRKQAVKTAIIGYLLIFILVVILKLSITPLTNWMYSVTTGH